MNDANTFHLAAQIDISTVSTFCEELRKFLDADKDIIFDASKVERITTPGVQLLITIASQNKKTGNRLGVVLPSESFKKTISDLGFSNQLKEWMGEYV